MSPSARRCACVRVGCRVEVKVMVRVRVMLGLFGAVPCHVSISKEMCLGQGFKEQG
jgi:hypothetical protein